MKYFVSIILLSLFISCNFNSINKNREEDKKDAEKITDQFYNLIKQNNKEEIFKLCGNELFKLAPKEKVNQMLDTSSSQFGNIESYSLIYWETTAIKGTNSKNEYILIYNVERDIKNTQEKFTLHKDNDSIKIVGYYINPAQ